MPPSRRPLALNPSFAAAHGLATSSQPLKEEQGKHSLVQPKKNLDTTSGSKRFELLLNNARTSGKLHAANAGLQGPLPDAVFDLRSGITVDLSMKGAASDATPTYMAHAEETLTLVDFSDNDIGGAMDERVSRYTQVQIMRWKRCSLTDMVHLNSLEKLRILDLAGNQLSRFQFDWLPNNCLQDLNLADNQLCEVLLPSNETMCFQHLETMDLSCNQLANLECEKLSTPHLRTFRASNNKLQAIPSFLSTTTDSLQLLDLAHNKLNSAAEDLSNYKQLQTLVLAFNGIETIPCVGPSVTRFDMTTNKLTSIQGMLSMSGGQSNLVDLVLHDNYLAEVDNQVIAKCVKLRRLDLSANKLKNLPYELGFLPELIQISLAGNALVSFKASDIQNTTLLLQVLRNRAPKGDGQQDTSSKILSSSIIKNTSIQLQLDDEQSSDTIGQLVQELKGHPEIAFDITDRLVLDNCHLESVHDDLLPLLPKIGEVSICNNSLTTLPLTLTTSCPNLKRLLLNRNKITDVELLAKAPAALSWSQSLTYLDLSANLLTSFPGSIFEKLPVLETLRLAFCKLVSVDDWTLLPKTLTTLDLSENAIENIDQLVLQLGGNCSKLSVLCLQHNYITRIPATLGLLSEYCPDMKVLNLKGNPQHSVRPEVLAKPTSDQLTYLKNRLTLEQTAHAKSQIEAICSSHRIVTINDDIEDDDDAIDTHVKEDSVPENKSAMDKETGITSELQVPPSAEVETIASVPGPKTTTIPTKVEKDIPESTTMALDLMDQLKQNIKALEMELESLSLSQAKRYALKKSLAMERSKLLREERKRNELGKK